jgi:hypothetical protein
VNEQTTPPKIEVTNEDVKLWLDGVKNLSSLESRRQQYRKQYNVDYKIRAAKRADNWPPEPTREIEHAKYFRDLVSGLTPPEGFITIQDYLGICNKTFQRYCSGATQPPRPTILLLEFMNHGDLGILFGKDWEGFTIKGGQMFAPYWGWRRGFEPINISYMFFGFQRLRTYEREIEQLKTKTTRLEANLSDTVRVRGKPVLRLVRG